MKRDSGVKPGDSAVLTLRIGQGGKLHTVVKFTPPLEHVDQDSVLAELMAFYVGSTAEFLRERNEADDG